MRLSKLSVSFDDTRIQSPLGEDFYKGLWSKLDSKFQYFSDSSDLKMVTSKNQNSVLDSSTVFYSSANIFIIKFGNAILHLTSNGNLFYCNTTLYNCDFGQKTGAIFWKQASRVPPFPYVLEFINAYLFFFWVHF
jgi:hypothetical protein